MSLSVFDDPFSIFESLESGSQSDHLSDLFFDDTSSVDSSIDSPINHYTATTSPKHNSLLSTQDVNHQTPEAEVIERPAPFSRGVTWDSTLEDNILIALNPNRGHKHMTRLISDLNAEEFEILIRTDVAIENRREMVFSLPEYTRCLTYLCFGRDSDLFHFNRRKMAFEIHYNYRNSIIRVPGLTEESLQNMQQFGVELGSRIQRLKYTVKEIDKRIEDHSTDVSDLRGVATLIAFTECVSRIVKNLERFVGVSSNLPINVVNSFQSSHKLVSVLTALLGCYDLSVTVKLSELPSPYRLLDDIYTRAVVFYHSDPDLFEVIKLLLIRCTEPWFHSVSKLLGLQNTNDNGDQRNSRNGFSILWQPLDIIASQMPFIGYDEETKEITLDGDQAPLFLDEASALKIIQTLNCLLVFVHHSKNDSLILYLNSFHDAPQLKWLFTETEIDLFEQDLERYSKHIESATKTDSMHFYELGGLLSETKETATDVPMKDEDSSENVDDTEIDGFFQEPSAFQELVQQKHIVSSTQMILSEDSLDAACREVLGSNRSSTTAYHAFTPHIPIEMLPRLGFCKLIDKQWEIANRLVLNTFFSDSSKFLMYKNLVHGLSLLGFGPFLTDVLDTIFESSHVNPKTGALGLEIETRTKWPPKEAEINGGLSDVVEDAIMAMGYPDDIPLNFGLCDKENHKDSETDTRASDIEATDALKLQFNIPMPYSLVLTPRVLKICNRIFSRLLRLYRIHQLLITSRRRHNKGNKGSRVNQQAQHLIYCILNHTQTAIATNWAQLNDKCNALHQLITLYDRTMEQMYRAVFISGKVQKATEEILSCCLQGLKKGNYLEEDVVSKISELSRALEPHKSTAFLLYASI